jgi:transposase
VGRIFGLNPLSTELNPICHLLALLGAHHIFYVSRIRVNGKGEARADGFFSEL